MDSCARRSSASSAVEQAVIPTLLRKDSVALQSGVCLGVAFAAVVLNVPLGLQPLDFDVAAVSEAAQAAKAAVSALDRALIMVLGLVIALVSASAREALRHPKLAAHATGRELLRTLLQLSGDIFLIPFYACFTKERPLLGYQSTPQNLEILSRCPSLLAFSQTPWLQNALWAFAALTVADNIGNKRARKNIRRELVKAPDGGVLALDWWEDAASEPAAKPRGVLFVNSTFVGDATPFCVRTPCKHFTSRGWRCVVFVKRGCGLTMPNTQPASAEAAAPWCLLGLRDLKLAIDHVANACPDVPICGLGLSTGAGQLRNYVNSVGKDSKLSAAVLLDAAPEWPVAIESCDKRMPLITQIMSFVALESFKACGHPAKPTASYSSSEVVRGGMLEFVCDVMAPAHGFERSLAGAREYMRSCQPAHASGCSIPVLELCTTNDMLMTAEMAQMVQSMYKASPHVITAMTHRGTHMIRWEGWRPRCWVTRVSDEFFQSVLWQPKIAPASVVAKPTKAILPASPSSSCGQDLKVRSEFQRTSTYSV